ncbi:MAG: T9SS type A sorting domain-containing protein [Bacteroidia bacterium]
MKITNFTLKFYFIILYFFMVNSLFSQAPAWNWVSTGGGVGISNYATSCVNDNAGNTFLSGLHNDTMMIQKFDPNGNLVWMTKPVIKGSVPQSRIYDIALDSFGNVYVGGTFHDTCYFGSIMLISDTVNSNPSSAGFLAKLDPNGNFIWAINAIQSSSCQSVAVDQNNDIIIGGTAGIYSNFVISGQSVSITSPKQHLFMAKINSSGVGIWAKVFESAPSNPTLGKSAVHDICTDNSGNVYFTGYFSYSVNFGGVALTASGSEIYLAKLDANGNTVWVKQSNSSLSYKGACGQGVGVDASGDVYLLGWIEENTNFGSFTATYGGTPSSQNTIVLVKYNSSGTEQWAKAFGKVKSDSYYGRTIGYSLTSSGDSYIGSSAGNFVSGGIDFGDGISQSFPVNGFIINYVVKVNNSGVTQWAKFNNSNTTDKFYSSSIDAAENVYVCGYWITGTGFDNLIAPTGPYGILLAKLGSNPINSITDYINNSSAFLIYPNPATNQITIQSEQAGVFDLLDIQGRVLQSFTVNNSQETIPLNYSAGMYFIREQKSGVVQKVIIE